MFNSQNLPYDVTYNAKTVEQTSKAPELTIGLSQYDLWIYTAELAEQDRRDYLRKQQKSEISQLDGLWSQYLAV